jgi:Flp pilus assembly protein TadD
MTWPHSVVDVGFLLAIAIAFRAGTSVHAQAEPGRAHDRQITFNRDIAPIMFQSCARCHRPGESGPFPLLNYDDVKKHTRQIGVVTRTRFMPPWLPERQGLKFADESRLTDEQIATIKKWVDEGAPEGNPADLPPQPKWVEGWQLGKPDLVLKAAKPYELAAGGSDMYWNFIFPVPVDRPRWIKAVEIRPGDKRFVHHANILVDRQQNSRQKEKEPGTGFEGMEIKIESETFDPDSHFLFWKPGTVPYAEPDGMALRLDKGTDLVLNVHLQPSGKPETIQPTIGLYFTDQPATKFPMLLQLQNDAKLDIPAGEQNFIVSDELTIPVDVDLLAIYPHAHYLGKDLQATAILPDGSTTTLIHIPQWNLNWQAVYRYAEPVFLPKGTSVRMRYIYDNSEDNALNPNHPPRRVQSGNRSNDEMAHLWLQVLPRKVDPQAPDPRMFLQEALARHNIRNNPTDFAAHYNLASMLQAGGNTAEATTEYEEAVRIRPEDATANNGLGAVLMASGQTDRAITHLQIAARTSPAYFDAHYNLGSALASVGDFPGAAEQFAVAVGIRPEDAGAHANFGSALAELGRFVEAKRQFERALEIDPGHTLARENLQQLQGAMGNH